ncbi:CPBP family intramembrane glutamic endopeptidase [Paenibacillus sp. GCM10012306]|uniref:CPBP family intramembrane glutamic endopeptidase n=1 Tax=Paenibacillus sp. GCM10012306 TaxID=3317342 RepID=UPI00360BDD8A
MSNQKVKASFSQRRPIWTVIIIEGLLLLAMMAAGTYATIKQLSYTAPVLIAFVPIALVLIAYFTIRHKWSYMGFRPLGSIPATNWIYYAPLLLILIINMLKGFRGIELSDVLFYLFFTLLVGFVEESIYRGLILKTLLTKSVKTAVVTSSILFSITHILNALSGQNLTQTLLQIVYALLIGTVLALLMVKNNNIIPLILFHFLHNLIQFVGNDNTDAFIGYDLLILAVLAAYAIWIAISLKRTPVPSGLNHAG